MIIGKKALTIYIFVLFIVLLFAGGCGSPEQTGEVETPEEPAEAEEETADLFTLEELAQFDGQDGRPAYIAVDGVVYDVTDVRQWGMGEHFGFAAGSDVTEALKNAPHGSSQLNQAKVVGRLAD